VKGLALLGLVWRHRYRLLRWVRFMARALPRVIAGDRSAVLAELRLLALVDGNDRFSHVRVGVAGGTAQYSGLVFAADDVLTLEGMATRFGLTPSVTALRVRRARSRPARLVAAYR
jgi:hypothetical protein